MIHDVTLILDEETYYISVKENESILTAALEAGIDAPYSCQGGICATCMAKIEDGEVKMIKNTILTNSEISDGFILTCQSHPVTQSITINYDDV